MIRIRKPLFIGARLLAGRRPAMHPNSLRFSVEDVRDFIGSLHAKGGETTERGWDRAEDGGWVVVEVLVESTLQ